MTVHCVNCLVQMEKQGNSVEQFWWDAVLYRVWLCNSLCIKSISEHALAKSMLFSIDESETLQSWDHYKTRRVSSGSADAQWHCRSIERKGPTTSKMNNHLLSSPQQRSRWLHVSTSYLSFTYFSAKAYSTCVTHHVVLTSDSNSKTLCTMKVKSGVRIDIQVLIYMWLCMVM